jgi:hypothetical protein
MRAILALAILMLGLPAAAAEGGHQDLSLSDAAPPLASSLESNVPVGDTDRQLDLAVPAKPSDAPHDQGEAIDSPPPPDPANTESDAEGNAADSIDDLCNAVLTSAEDNDLPVAFFANLIWQESRLQFDAVSRAGAQGIAQFMPQVAVEVGLDNPFDPHQAIPASARLLHVLREHFGNLGFVAAAYNAGAHRVAEWLDHRRALPLQTRTYVLRVTGQSVEAWRKSPLDDSRLTFVRPLPCRELPAFADLEQAQLRVAREVAPAQQSPPQAAQEKPAAEIPQTFAHKMNKNTLTARRLVAERKQVRKVGRPGNVDKIAHTFHGEKHDATHRQHAAHEKRKVA